MYMLPLQTAGHITDVTPEQLDQTVSQLSESTIALAEAAANFGALKVIFAAFVIFTFIILTLFLYQVIATTKKVEKIHQSTQKLEKSFEITENRSIGASQASLMVRRVFSSLKQNSKYIILRTRIENHLDRKEAIVAKVSRLVSNNWTELHSFLSNFDYKGKSLATYINDSDAQAIIDTILELVYQDSSIFTVGLMEQTVDIMVDGMKFEILKNFE